MEAAIEKPSRIKVLGELQKPCQSFLNLTLFRMGGVAKRPLSTSFSSVTSTNVGFRPKNFLTFSFNPFSPQLQNFKFAPSASLKLLNLNQDYPSKKWFFWSNPYKIEVMITSLKETLELSIFGHMITPTI